MGSVGLVLRPTLRSIPYVLEGIELIRIGTRGSKLALWQAEWVTARLRELGYEVEVKIISTRGDVTSQPLSEVGGQGLFTKEIQRELLAENVDIAVHSLKDLPTAPVEGLVLAAVPERETTEDCLLSRDRLEFEMLPAGSIVGTGSSRRAAQLRAWRSDVKIQDIRGNVDSRIRKLHAGEFDAIVLAAAGLNRLGLIDQVAQRLPQNRMLPAVGQGALGIECRASDQRTTSALSRLNHRESMAAITAERTLLAELLAGCLAPVAALAKLRDGQLWLRARVLACDGKEMIECDSFGSLEDAQALGATVASELLSRGAERLIATARKNAT